MDAHRSIALVISKYSPRRIEKDKLVPFVDHTFYSTVNMVHSMERLLDVPPMNNNDGRAALMAPLFSGSGNQPAYNADRRNLENKLIYQVNARDSAEARLLDFSRPDASDAGLLNRMLWKDRMGNRPMPVPRRAMLLRLTDFQAMAGTN